MLYHMACERAVHCFTKMKEKWFDMDSLSSKTTRVDYTSQVLDEQQNRILGYWVVALNILLVFSFAISYGLSLFVSKALLERVSQSTQFQSAIHIVPLNYFRFLEVSSVERATRAWLLEAVLLTSSTVIIFAIIVLTVKNIAGHRSTILRMKERPIALKDIAAVSFFWIVVPTLMLSQSGYALIVGGSRFTLGPTDVVQWFLFFGMILLVNYFWSICILGIAILVKAGIIR